MTSPDHLAVLTPEPLLITGDINIHVDVPDDPDAIKFLDLLDSLGLAQHVKTPTHRCGHTLDLMITREINSLFIFHIQGDDLFEVQ